MHPIRAYSTSTQLSAGIRFISRMTSITIPSNTAESSEAKSELLYKDIIKRDLNLTDPQYNVIYYEIETKIRERNLLGQPLRIILKKK